MLKRKIFARGANRAEAAHRVNLVGYGWDCDDGLDRDDDGQPTRYIHHPEMRSKALTLSA